MAERKKPELGPVLDSSQADNTVRIIRALSEREFKNFIRYVMRVSREEVLEIRNATFYKLRELKISRNKSRAWTETPAGSGQTSSSAIIEWLGKVKPQNKAAIRQVVTLDATAVLRSR